MKIQVKDFLKLSLTMIVAVYFIRIFKETGWPFIWTDLTWGLFFSVTAIILPRIKAHQKAKYQAKWRKPTNRR